MSEGIPYPPDLVVRFLSTLRLPLAAAPEEVFAALDEALRARPWPRVGALHKGVEVSHAGTALSADLVLPERAGGPILLYVHGGGWEAGSPGSHRRIAHELAARGFVTLVPRYRLGPTHRHPAQLEDLDAALEWARQGLGSFGADCGVPVTVAGDSAGAHLAAALAIRRRLEGRDGVGAAILLTGIFEYHEGIALVGPYGHDRSTQPLLEPSEFERHRRDPVVNPLLGAAELPPSFVGVGGADPFAAQGCRLFEALRCARVPADLDWVDEAPHLHYLLPGLPGSAAGLDRAASFARRVLDGDAVAH